MTLKFKFNTALVTAPVVPIIGNKYKVIKPRWSGEKMIVGRVLTYTGVTRLDICGHPTPFYTFSNDECKYEIDVTDSYLWEYIHPYDSPLEGLVSGFPCSNGHKQEDYVNVGFMTIKYACKHCGKDKLE